MTSLSAQLAEIARDQHKDRATRDAAVRRLESLLLSAPALSTTFQAHGRLRAVLNEMYEAYETDLENDFAAKVLSEGAPIEQYPLYERFSRLVRREVREAGIGSNSRVLFIGSGPFPISPILLHKLSGGASVDCFDQSEEACETSAQVLEKLGLSDAIKVFNVTAQDARRPTFTTPGEMTLYNVVVVALLAQPKENVMRRLWGSVGVGPRIVMRNSEGTRRLIYEGINTDYLADHRFKRVGEYHAGVDDTISGLVLQTDFQPRVFRL